MWAHPKQAAASHTNVVVLEILVIPAFAIAFELDLPHSPKVWHDHPITVGSSCSAEPGTPGRIIHLFFSTIHRKSNKNVDENG